MIRSTDLRRRCLVSCLGILAGLASVLTTLASSAQAGYVPPPNADAPTAPTTGGGRRGGCQGAGEIDLVALAPLHHIGLTQSTHPTLVWFAPTDIRQPLELELYERDDRGRWQSLDTFTLVEGQTGIMAFTWPAEEPGLTVGKTYRWQVISTCVVGLPSRDLVTTAELQVTAPLLQQATLPADPVAKAQHYAAAGLWYDALAAVATTPASAGAAYRRELLLDLADLEAAASPNAESYLSIQLQRIVAEE